MQLILLVASVLLTQVNALNCTHKATIIEDVKDGPIEKELEVEINEGSIECGKGLDRCATFANMSIVDFLKLDAAVTVKDLALKDGQIVGSTCISQKDCAAIKAVTQSACNSTESSCCCATDDCDEDSSPVSTTTIKSITTTSDNSMNLFMGALGMIAAKMLM
ncbi:hypothetical protein PENTCL1PPCAC_5209 [Pristionchus entomophagus]|uniref:Uncharacterized protein n=1 Tax=Pristionchus entomophagus TaxID=358040 RepID=A0AAV5SS68_9BILA|nr:hypothetical protein PENTCL1PPCAC_5209 [Pristionchus entomophagus]